MNREREIKKEIEVFLETYQSELLSEAEKLKTVDISVLTEELFSEFERTGNRLKYENVYFGRRKRLSVYGIAVSVLDRYEYMDELEKILVDICKEQCWALPAHVDRSGNTNWEITIDLFVAETAFALAEIVGKMKGKISSPVYEMVKKEVFRRVLTPFMESQKPYADWEVAKMNWCAVCNGAIGGAAIWLMDEEDGLADEESGRMVPVRKKDELLERVCSSILNYIDGFSEDGACPEGLGYYTYGLSFFVAFADLMHQYSNGQVDLLSGNRCKNIALFQQKCYLSDNVTLSFSDCDREEKFRVGLTAYLAMRYKDVRFPDFGMAAGLESDTCYRYLILSRDILFAQHYLDTYKMQEESPVNESMVGESVARKNTLEKYTIDAGTHIILADAQWSICKSDNDIVLAIKGGHNDEPHNHNDIGSFIYVCAGQQMITDLGAGEYTKDYFGDNRYQNICCRSLGHSVPIIEGKEQLPGTCHRATVFEADGKGRTRIGIERAYDLSEDEKITRTVDFDTKTGECRITDEFLLHEGCEVIENLITVYEPKLNADHFIIDSLKGSVRVHCPGGCGYRIIRETYADHFGNEQNVWLMQWKVNGKYAKIRVSKV